MLGSSRTATQRSPLPCRRAAAAFRRPSSSILAALALTAALLPPHPLCAVPVDRLSSPRPAHWALDTTGTLSAADIARIDAAVESVRAETGGEIAVVVVDSTDGQPPHDFATTLANRWLIGDQVLRNGILILLAKADRRAEIALGKGIDGKEQRRIAQEILDGEMAPRFGAGDYAGGLLAAVDGAAKRILQAPRKVGEALPGAKGAAAGTIPATPEPSGRGTIRAAWGLATLAVLGLSLLVFVWHRRSGAAARRGPETRLRKRP